MKPRLLDLFCGAGGAAMGYSRAGFEVVGVDVRPQPNYPFDFVQADALEYLGGAASGYVPVHYDAIHASPPCQAYAGITRTSGRPEDHPDLIAPTRELLVQSGLPYVIENVMDARRELIDPVRLCGSSFGLGVRRHRLFECSFPVMVPPCAHGQQRAKYRVYEHGRWYMTGAAKVYGSGGGKAVEEWPEAMGIDWMTSEELAQAIPPAMTEHIGHYMLAAVRARASA